MGRYTGKKCRLLTMLWLTGFFFLVEIIVGYVTNSMALIADSFHMLSDVAALVVAFLSVKVSAPFSRSLSECFSCSNFRKKISMDFSKSCKLMIKSRSIAHAYDMKNNHLSLLIGQMSPKKWSKNTFGWARAEVLGALVNAVFLVALCFSITVEACKRFIEVEKIHEAELLVAVGVLGLFVNVIGLCLFHGKYCVKKIGLETESQTQNRAHRKMCVACRPFVNVIAGMTKAVIRPKLEQVQLVRLPRALRTDESSAHTTSDTNPLACCSSCPVVVGQSIRCHIPYPSSQLLSSSPFIHSLSLEICVCGQIWKTEKPLRGKTHVISEHGSTLGHSHGISRSHNRLSTLVGGVTDDNENDDAFRPTVPPPAPPPPPPPPPPPIKRAHGHSHDASQMNMRGVFLHVLSDALGSVIVIISALIVWLTEWEYR